LVQKLKYYGSRTSNTGSGHSNSNALDPVLVTQTASRNC